MTRPPCDYSKEGDKMKRARKVRLFSTLLAAPLMWAGVAQANLVLNGDFETDASAFTSGPGYAGEAGNPSQIPDWVASSGGVPLPAGSQEPVGLNPGSGGTFTNNGLGPPEVAFLQGAITLGQTIEGFAPGATYSLTFVYNSREPGPFTGNALPDLTVSIASLSDDLGPVSDVGGGSYGGTEPYYSFSEDFVAGPSGTETLAFTSTPSPAGGDATALLGSISVNAVPEPACIGLLAIAGVGLLSRRRRA
jgi:hypothetical protein